MNRGERRERNERKWKSKLKKLWNSWGKRIGIWRKSGKADFETEEEFSKSTFAQDFKHSSSPWKNSHYNDREIRKRNLNNHEIPEIEDNEMDSLCCECSRYNTDDCSYPGKIFGSTRWRDINCKDFYS